MTIAEIYDKYRINKGLREHMIRVAAVGKMICDVSKDDLNTKNVVSACLLHDLGNIAKINFDSPPELFEPEGIEHYKKIKQEMFEKYGGDSSVVTLSMLSELTIDSKIITIIEATGLSKIPDVIKNGSDEEKIMMYSDLRVGLHGIVTADERLDDITDRYSPHRYTEEIIESGRSLINTYEKEIFKDLKISPEDINDETTKEIQEELWNWTISV